MDGAFGDPPHREEKIYRGKKNRSKVATKSAFLKPRGIELFIETPPETLKNRYKIKHHTVHDAAKWRTSPHGDCTVSIWDSACSSPRFCPVRGSLAPQPTRPVRPPWERAKEELTAAPSEQTRPAPHNPRLSLSPRATFIPLD